MDFLVSAVIDFDVVRAEYSPNSVGFRTNIWKACTLDNFGVVFRYICFRELRRI